MVGILFRDGVRIRKGLLFRDELKVRAGEKGELTVKADMFYIFKQAFWIGWVKN